ncbi:hypothetical protein [Syntrophomonas wolfei]|jgi:hypothetical protein|uniref:Uncharacterized protein n=1 Tax=Syntrophomonas wolfei TaxID=863 RepID=A0A354YXG5_9FIRM|nr:hypothetical protein [Syntrophomonas wolfei]HBK54038.1 hypothetical protein [Syntrophomonas wolfei]
MDSEIIRAYLWQDIIKFGFCPSSTKEKRTWLRQYCGSLRGFWEVDSYPSGPHNLPNQVLQIKINNIGLIGFDIDCTIHTNTKFNAQVLYSLSGKKSSLMWSHDADDSYFAFPNQKLLTSVNSRIGNRRSAVREFSTDDVISVIDGLLLHPTVHMHLLSLLDRHEIRIGSGIGNPFQYLFNLRYQLCPIPEKRVAEKERLVEIFSNAIRSKRPVPACELMAQPRLK